MESGKKLVCLMWLVEAGGVGVFLMLLMPVSGVVICTYNDQSVYVDSVSQVI